MLGDQPVQKRQVAQRGNTPCVEGGGGGGEGGKVVEGRVPTTMGLINHGAHGLREGGEEMEGVARASQTKDAEDTKTRLDW